MTDTLEREALSDMLEADRMEVDAKDHLDDAVRQFQSAVRYASHKRACYYRLLAEQGVDR